ncbi:MAG: glycosyltransferase family 9 protein [Candidatus Omnitrophica bacterium]|nr:glycosyltransferase family 9 protein [Candidatus Omnitrophota bacterium]
MHGIKKILFITLSNIGDVVLTLPVFGMLKNEFPAADIAVMTGSPAARELFEQDPRVKEVIIYDKRARFSQKLGLGLRLRKKKFDLVVDLRNSIFPVLAGARYSTFSLVSRDERGLHRKDKHLARLKKFGLVTDKAGFPVYFNDADKNRVKLLLKELGISTGDRIVAVSAGAKSHTKRWPVKGFIDLCKRLAVKMGVRVLLIGDKSDAAINKEIASAGINGVYDITGRTNLRELAYLLSLSRLLVTNDSAPLHVASSVNTPTVAIFGPTDHKKYGPLAQRSAVVRKGLLCSPCGEPQCKFNTLACILQISDDEVWDAIHNGPGTI